MITLNDIADCLEEMVKEKFPGEEIYRELTPSDFARPSNLIAQDECPGEVGYGCEVVELRPKFTLTTFVKTDEYHHSHLADLHARQMRLVAMLLPGYIKVAHRAPKIVALKMSGGYDYAIVEVTFSLTLDRNDFIEIEQLPVAGELHLNEEVNT